MKRFSSSFSLVVLVFALLCAPLILSRHEGGYADDETNFHLPAVRQIRSHWPALDLNRDALSAVSPGYHYLLATVSLVTGSGRLPMRVITWGISLALLGLLWRLFPDNAGTVATTAVLPLACSNFFVKSASWTVTDNPGLLGVAVTLAAVFLSPGTRGGWLAGAAAAAATFLRQVHVWTVVPVGLRALRETRATPGARRRISAFFPVLLPLGVMAILLWRWGGLVPPKWQTMVYAEASSPTASLCYLMAVFLILGICYYAAFTVENPGAGFRSSAARIGGVAGLALALAGPTSYSMPAGRWGGYLWSAAAHLPTVGGRSPLFIVLSPLGAALLGVMTVRLARQTNKELAAMWLGSYLAWAVTFLTNRLVFHRYYEPMTLVFLVFWVLLMRRGTPAAAVRTWPLYALTLVQLIITIATAHYQTLMPPVAAGG